MNVLKYTHPDMTPEVYREGGGGLGGIFKSALHFATLGTSLGTFSNMFDIKPPEMPKLPDAPEAIMTGQTVKEGGQETLKEDAISNGNARKTARKGTTKFRIPLASTATGVKASGGSGLKI